MLKQVILLKEIVQEIKKDSWKRFGWLKHLDRSPKMTLKQFQKDNYERHEQLYLDEHDQKEYDTKDVYKFCEEYSTTIMKKLYEMYIHQDDRYLI